MRYLPFFILIAVLVLLLLFIILKHEELARLASSNLRQLSGQSGDLASSGDLLWLGFSFLAFRLLHVVRDRQTNRLPAFSLVEFASYALFFPAVISGPRMTTAPAPAWSLSFNAWEAACDSG